MNKTKYQITYYHKQQGLFRIKPTPELVARLTYRRIKKRVSECAYYKDLFVPTQDELTKFYKITWRKFMKFHKLWSDSGFHHNDYPSIDRIDPNRGYEIDNLRTLPKRDNSRLSVKNRIKGKLTHCPQRHKYTESNSSINIEGYRFCKKCNQEKSLKGYYKRKNKNI